MILPRLVIAGTHSGVGKTTVTLAVIAALRRRGLAVQPFKVGPDFLDPLQHAAAAGRPCRNLDSWLLPPAALRAAFVHGCAGAAIAVTEGVMGLYDGKDPDSETASTAEVAKQLGAPVLLVVDASGMARSVAALLDGFRRFDPAVALAGVIFNRVGSARHRRWLAAIAAPHLPVFGGLPADGAVSIPERHLGLVPPAPAAGVPADQLADLAEAHLEIDRLIALARSAPALAPVAAPPPSPGGPRRRIAVARDAAFQFYYPDNLEALARAGAELIPFSPLSDPAPPAAADGIYLGGGYPEIHAAALAANHGMRAAIGDFAARGGVIYAECGGMMYLAEAIRTTSGERFPMVGVLRGVVRMRERLAALGYVEVEAQSDGPLLAAGARARGHEFHYSEWERPPIETDAVRCAYRLLGSGRTRAEGYRYKNTLASYVHLHFGSCPGAAERLVACCAAATAEAARG